MTVAHGAARLEYRKAKPEDAPTVLPLIRAAYRNKGDEAHLGWTTEAHLLDDDRIDEQGLVDKINHPGGGGMFMVFEKSALQSDGDDKLVACFEMLPRGDGSDGEAYFGLFAVDPRRQGGGLGKRIMAYSEEYAVRNWGARSMELQVIGTRDDIIAWYVRRGYAKTGQRREFPYKELVNGKAFRDDLYFEVLTKELPEKYTEEGVKI